MTDFTHVCKLQTVVDTGNECLNEDTVYGARFTKYSILEIFVPCVNHSL